MDSFVSLREFRSEMKNGLTFSVNPTDFSQNLIGSVQDRIQATTRVRVIWTATASLADIITINGNTLSRQSGSFLDDGFALGDTIDVKELLIFKASDRVILSITDTVIIFDGPAEPLDFSQNYLVFGKTAKHGFKFRYGLIENAESPNYLSKIDNSIQEFYADGVGAGPIGSRSTAVVPCQVNNQFKSWQNGGCTVQFIQEGYDTPVAANASYYYQEYEIVHTFDMLPYFRDGEIPALINGNPPADLFASGKSLKYAMQSDHLSVLSNPNGVTTAEDSQQLGSVGWFNENFNNFNNNYSIDSVAYQDVATATAVGRINAAEQTEVTITVDSANGTFAANSKFTLCVSYLPDVDGYQPDTSGTLPRNPQNFTVNQNFLLDRQYQEVGQPATGAGILTDVVGTFINANEIEVVGKIGYNATQQALLDDSKYYLVSVIVEDDSLTNETSDRVNLLADINTYDLDADVSGMMLTDNAKFKILAHNEVITDAGTTDYKGWIEDTFLVSFPFFVNLSAGATIQTIEANFVAYDQAAENHFVIQPYQFNIAGTPIVNGGQQFNVLDTRGYELESGSIFNRAQITTRGDTVIGPDTFREYTMQIAIRANFEDHTALPTADPNFTNINDPNNGLNKLSSNYSDVLGYQIKVFIDAAVEAYGTVTQYRFMTPDLSIKEWDKSDVEPALWQCEINTFDQSGNDLNGGISDTENTKVQGKFTLTTGPAPLTGMWAYIHLYETPGTIFSLSELSSVQNSASNNRLVPLVGQSFTQITTVGSDVFVECEVDYTKINPTKGYYLEARLATESDALIVDIQTTFIGGASGTWNANIVLQDAGNNPLPNGVNVFLTLKEGAATIGQAEYLVGDTIGVDAPQSSSGIWTGMLPYIPSVLIADGMLLQFAKKDWALATNNYKNVCLDSAIEMDWLLQASDGVNTSNIASDTMGIESDQSFMDFPFRGGRIDGNLMAFGDYLNGRHRLLNTATGKTETFNTITQAIDAVQDTNTVTNGKSAIMTLNFLGVSGNHFLRRHEYDGTCWQQVYQQTLTFPGAWAVQEDPNEIVNGKSALWVSTQRGNSPPRQAERLLLLEWNGASYTITDFDTLVEQIYLNETANNTFTNISINGIIIDSNQDIYVTARITLGVSANSQLWRLRQTGPTYNNPADWTAKLMAGLGSGNADGIGTAALFDACRGFDIIGYDGIEGQVSGTDPMFMISDGGPNVIFKRGVRDIPTDTYNITTEYGGTAGDQDGIGTNARFTVPRDVVSFADLGYMMFTDNTNDKIYKVDMGTQQVTSFAGFQLSSYQESIDF